MRRAPPTVPCLWLLISILQASKVAVASNSNLTWNLDTSPGLSSYQISVSDLGSSPSEDSSITLVIGLCRLERSVSLLPFTAGLANVLVQTSVLLVSIAFFLRSRAVSSVIATSTTDSASAPRVGVE